MQNEKSYYFFGKYNLFIGKERKNDYGMEKYYPFIIFETIEGTPPKKGIYIRDHNVVPISKNVNDTKFYEINLDYDINNKVPSYYIKSNEVSYYSTTKEKPIFVAKGIVKVKIKNDVVTFLTNEQLQNGISNLIIQEVKNKKYKNGKYKILYSFINIIDLIKNNSIEIIH